VKHNKQHSLDTNHVEKLRQANQHPYHLFDDTLERANKIISAN